MTPDFNYVDGRSYYVYLLLKYFKRLGHNLFLYTNAGDSFDRLGDHGIPYLIDPYLSAKSSFIKSVNVISEFTRENHIDIIHSHHRYYELIANAVSIQNQNLKTVFTALSIVDTKYFVEYKSDVLIAVSNSVREMLTSKFKIRTDKIELIPNFVESEEFLNGNNEIDSEKTPGSKVKILSAGRFHKEKDYLTLLKALLILKDQDVSLTLIGEGPEKAVYQNFINDNDINAKLVPPQKDLTKYFKETDICILTSVRDPFPGFMLQAGLHSKPFIGSNVDGISELITDQMNGLLFEKQNAEELSEKIFIFMKDRTLALRCGENLQFIVKKSYTDKTVIPMIEKVYEKLIN